MNYMKMLYHSGFIFCWRLFMEASVNYHRIKKKQIKLKKMKSLTFCTLSQMMPIFTLHYKKILIHLISLLILRFLMTKIWGNEFYLLWRKQNFSCYPLPLIILLMEYILPQILQVWLNLLKNVYLNYKFITVVAQNFQIF